MNTIEQGSSLPERHKERIYRSVRVFAIAQKKSSQLYEELSAGIAIDQLSPITIVLARKNNTRLVTALGGKMLPGEDLLQASGRKVYEESLLTRESQRKLKHSVGSGRAIPYVRTDTGRKCEAFLTVMPVRSATESLHDPWEPEHTKSVYEITELVHVTPSELAELFSKGFVLTARGEEFRMFGHLTQAPVQDVQLSEEARHIQNREFSRVLDEVNCYEFEIKNEMILQINRIRHLHHISQISSLGQCGKEEIVHGYILAKWSLGMADNQLRDKDNETIPPYAQDLPTSALYLREFPPEELADALMSAPTKEVRRARNALFHALRKTVADLYELMGMDLPYVASNSSSIPKPMDTVTALRYIWPDVLEKSPETITTYLSILDAAFTAELGEHLNKPDVIIRRALSLPSELPSYIAEELRGLKKDTFQEYFPPNEVASAIERPFVQILYIFGLHPYRNVSAYTENEAMKRIRGDILMQLAIQLSAIPAVEQQMAADNSLFEKVLADFMKLPPELDQLQLKQIPHTVYSRETEVTIDGKPLQMWHDKKMIKSILRLWLKSLQEPVVYDLFSHNFVIRDANFSEADRNNISLRFDKVTAFRKALIAHCQKELESDGWSVSIVPGTHKTGVIDTVRKIVSVQTDRELRRLIASTKYKKRSGSIANTIVREKFVIAFTKNGKTHYTEICIYPLERTNADGSTLTGKKLLGFVETLLDHMDRNYNGHRLIQPDEKDPTSPSVLEIIRPPAWQRHAFDGIWPLQHRPKRKRKK